MSDFNETVLRFFDEVADHFVLKNQSAAPAIRLAYENWHKLLEVPPELQQEVLIGLWGELFVIQDVLENGLQDPSTLMNSWTGSAGAPNDFTFGNACIDVKTTRGSGHEIKISSIDQLDAPQAWLVVIRIQQCSDKHEGYSLLNLVEKIRNRLGFADARLLESRVNQVIPRVDSNLLDEMRFQVSAEPSIVSIDGRIPMLTTSRLAQIYDSDILLKLKGVSYSLDLRHELTSSKMTIHDLFMLMPSSRGEK